MKKLVSVVVTDLDDTLWNWVDIWYYPFRAMLDKVIEISGISQEELLRDFKEVYTRHGTSEYAFALEELPSLLHKHQGEDIQCRYAAAIEAYREARRQVLTLYPDVLETLEKIRDRGALIVGYTESLAFYTRYRLVKFGLDRTLDLLYSPADHDLPEGLSAEEIRKYSPERYELRRTVHRHTPKGKEKPSPEVLRRILSDVGAQLDEAIYIGDKLVKDVAMAQSAGVTDVHAAYGEAHNREQYELLRKVTHWTPEAVKKERETTPDDVKPSHALHNSIAELFDHFEFVPFIDRSEARSARVVDVWKKTVEVQQHFNEIELKIRNYVITLVAAIFGGAGVAVKEHLPTLASCVLIFGVVGVSLFWMMDALWYHRLLRGAVRQATFIERRFSRYLPEMGLTQAITQASPLQVGGLTIRSGLRLNLFYLIMAIALIVGAIFLPRMSSSPATENTTVVTVQSTSSQPDTNTETVEGIGKAAPQTAPDVSSTGDRDHGEANEPVVEGVRAPTSAFPGSGTR